MIGFAIFAVVLFIFLVGLVIYLYPGKPTKPCSVPGLDPSDTKLGNLIDIQDEGGFLPFLKQLHMDYGPVASFWWGEKLVVSTSHPDMFRHQMGLFDRPADLFQTVAPLLGDESIYFINGSEGRGFRQTLDAAFTEDSCAEMVDIIRRETNALSTKLAMLPAGQHLALRQCMMALVCRVTLLTIFGDYFEDDERCLAFAKNYEICWAELEQRLLDPDSIADKVRLVQFQKAKAQLRRVVLDAIDRYESPISQGKCRKFIDILKDLPISDDQRFAFAITYATGGCSTIGNLMSWLLYFIITHDEWESTIREELNNVLADRPIKQEDIKKLSKCHQAIDETLRLSALVPYTARYTSVDLKIGSYVIPKETPIVQAIGVTLEDSSLWKNPMEYNPDHFCPEKLKSVDSLSYPFFGFAGKRKCPGSKLTYVEVVVYLAELLRKHKFTMVDSYQVVSPFYGIVTEPAEEIWVTVSNC